ncbi:MAG: flagellar motor switch protein FliG [Thiobacillus sp.]
MSDTVDITKGAILMLALGEEGAAEVMKHLGPREVQKLGEAMAALKPVPQEEVENVLEDFNNAIDGQSTFGLDSNNYIRAVMQRALGKDKATSLLNRILGDGSDASGIENLKWMDAESVAELIQNEHPQTISIILVHLERDQASGVLKLFPEPLRNDVMLRIATLSAVQPAALRELNDVLTTLLSSGNAVKNQPLGGTRAAADLINFLSGDAEASVMEHLKNYDEEMAQKIMDEMFVFENLLDIDDRGIQQLLREVQSDALIIALKGATEEVREKIFKNMSQRAAAMVREDLESKGPVRLSEVEAQQKEILTVLRRLADEGQIQMGAKGDDGFV